MKQAKYITRALDLNKVFLNDAIKLDDVVIDATMGNGYDTAYLAEKVGENGKVYAFDVQEQALVSTNKRLKKLELENRATLILDGHENIKKYVSQKVSCVIFNLGYLPRSKHNIVTRPDTTIEAIKQSLELLKPHGIISISLYTGHDGGQEEKDGVFEFLSKLDQTEFHVLNCGFINQINHPPQLILIEKKS